MRLFKILFSILFFASQAFAQSTSILNDVNGDGFVRLLAFGDSVTYGVGDGTRPGEFIESPPITDGTKGYPARIENLAGIIVDNRGFPGEEIGMGGAERFSRLVPNSIADIVILKEGDNDSFRRLDAGAYSRLVQKMINAAHATGKLIVIATLPRPCCDREGRAPFTDSYSQAIRELAFVNDIRFADIDRAWRTTCVNKEACELFNIPDGIHPNTKGYDVLAQTILSSLYGIDIFAPGGSVLLEGALGLPPGSIIVKPGEL